MFEKAAFSPAVVGVFRHPPFAGGGARRGSVRDAGVYCHLPWAGGGGIFRFPPSNFRTNERIKGREAAIENS